MPDASVQPDTKRDARRRPVSDLLAHHASALAAYTERVDETIAPDDTMLTRTRAHYLGVGHSAMAAITNSMIAARKDEAVSILDLPCGHGRVMRMLRARFPEARIVGCDIDRAGVDFCARQFAAEPVYSDVDPAKIPIDETFDLIWVGSFLTHLDEPLWRRFLRFFSDRLEDDGLLVFTTHGRYAALRPFAPPRLRRPFLRSGFAYEERKTSPGYGTSASSPSWVAGLLDDHPELTLISFGERAWNDHQDVVGLLKRPPVPVDAARAPAGPGGWLRRARFHFPSFARPSMEIPLPPDARPGHEAIGREFLAYFIDLGGLRRHECVLDVGSGNGRMAVRLAEYLEPPGRYEGFDVAAASVDWCQRHITPVYPHFRFRAVPVRSDVYNPTGTTRGGEYRFPYADSTFDFVIVISVFTHLLAADMQRYAAEIARVLAPGGRMFATYFLVTDDAERRLEAGTAKQPLVHRHDTVSFVEFPERPEAAIGYREEYAFRVLDQVGLRIGTVRHGSWSGRDDFLSYQDVVVAQAR